MTSLLWDLFIIKLNSTRTGERLPTVCLHDQLNHSRKYLLELFCTSYYVSGTCYQEEVLVQLECLERKSEFYMKNNHSVPVPQESKAGVIFFFF